MKEFSYGECGNNLGYGFLYEDGLSNSVKIRLEKSMTLLAKEESIKQSSLRYIPLEEGSLLLFLVNVSEGSCRDRRGEVFVWGYQFTVVETEALLRLPEKIFLLPTYSTYEEWLEDGYRREKVKAILEEAYVDKESSYLSKEELARIAKYYIYSVVHNHEELRCQLHQVFSILDKQAVEETVAAVLALFPIGVRRQIAFCINPQSIPETNGFEMNFVERNIYNGFIKSHYNGAIVVDRIAVFEDQVVTTISKEEIDAVYNSYLHCTEKELRSCTSRADFRALIDKKKSFLVEEKRKESAKKTVKSVPKSTKGKKERKQALSWKRRVINVIQVLLLLMITVALCSLLSIEGGITGEITIHISTSAIVFVLQFIVAFLWANLWTQHRKKKGEKET